MAGLLLCKYAIAWHTSNATECFCDKESSSDSLLSAISHTCLKSAGNLRKSQLTSHKSQVLNKKSQVINQKSQARSQKSKRPSRDSIINIPVYSAK